MNDRPDTLEELLNDPLVQLVMKRDKVRPEELRRSLERARRARRTLPPPHVIAEVCHRHGLCVS